MHATRRTADERAEFRTTMRSLFKLSYAALVRNLEQTPSFERWCYLKDLYDRSVARRIFGLIGHIGASEPYANMRLYYALYHIHLRHLQARVGLFRLSRCIAPGSRSLFVWLSFLQAYFDVLTRVAVETIACRKKLVLRGRADAPSAAVVIGFPAHSFNAGVDRASESAPSAYFSFGDFLTSERGEDEGQSIVSVGEYTRLSKAVERSGTSGDRAQRLEVLRAFASSDVRHFLSAFVRAARGVFGALLSAMPVCELEYVRSSLRSRRQLTFIAGLERAGVAVDKIYVLPFDDVGELRTLPETRHRIVNVNYSSNIFVPPINGLDDPGRLLPLLTYYLFGRAVGFTDAFRFVNGARVAVSRRYGCNLPTPPVDRDEIPLVLGFENASSQFECDAAVKSIALFDVPPHSFEDTLAAYHFGDRASHADVNEAFLREVTASGVQAGLRVILKPKYSLANYDSSYRALLAELERLHPGFFKVADPYGQIGLLLAHAAGAVSFPYTATMRIAAALGKPSIYYFPEKFDNGFFHGPGAYAQVARKFELEAFLSRL